MQRMQEIQSYLGPATAPAQTTVADASPAAFSTMLASAQAPEANSSLMPDNSLASGLPQLTNPTLSSMYGTAASPYGAAGTGYGDTSLSGSMAAAGMTPYLSSPINGVTFPWTGSGDVGRRMVALAQGEVGVREASGNNDGERIATYRTATEGAENTPGPWCSYFVSWLARQSGAPVGTNGAGVGYVPTLEEWGRNSGRFADGKTTPKPGDIVIFDWQGDGTADHTGIVERVDADGRVHTIEGNSSNMVARRDYAAGASSIRGYVHPG
ncbi:MAG: CHAP domain-containing protein [Thermoleophilia bacterium]|nr:CHAP domain-containing protein [Thermoleophilia bacterium]